MTKLLTTFQEAIKIAEIVEEGLGASPAGDKENDTALLVPEGTSSRLSLARNTI